MTFNIFHDVLIFLKTGSFIGSYVQPIKNAIFSSFAQPPRGISNLNCLDQIMARKLQVRTDIIIRTADKGDVFVVMDMKDCST